MLRQPTRDVPDAPGRGAAAARRERWRSSERPSRRATTTSSWWGAARAGSRPRTAWRGRESTRCAVVSRDPAPGGMFRRFPIYQRLISWTKPDAPFERGTREYEWYDHNSLVGDEPEHQALVRAVHGPRVRPARAARDGGRARRVRRPRQASRCATAASGCRRAETTTAFVLGRRTASTAAAPACSRSA